MTNLIAGTYFGGYVSDIEILWVLIALVGMIFSLHNVSETRQDLAVLRYKNIRNGRWKIAVTGLRAEVGRFIIQSIYLAVGIYAMFFPDPPSMHESLRVAAFRFLFQWGFIVSSLILTLKSYWNYELRQELVEHGVKLEPHETENNGAEE
jgi:hypothetical protein